MPTAAPKGAVKPGTDENVINLDFRNVGPRGGGRAARVPPGDYLLEVTSAKNVPIEGKPGERMISWQFRIVQAASDDPEAQAGVGDTVYARTGLGDKSLWFLRNLIEDLTGVEVTGKALGFQLDNKAGQRVGATLNWGREYTDKQGNEVQNSEIKYTFPADKFVSGSTAAPDAPQAAPAPKARVNGSAPAQAAAEALSAPDEDEDLEELSIQSL